MRHLVLIIGLIILAVFPISIQAQSAESNSVQSIYISMDDGTRIAVDIWLPAETSESVPTLLNATRYWRGLQNVTDPNPDVAFFNGAGYAVVVMDVRGTGASEGVQTLPWSDTEVSDLGEVMDWIVQQSWSNGRVGTYGVSYAGTLAELATLPNHPALAAVAPQFSFFDLLANLALPGGVYNKLGEDWQMFNERLDSGDPCAFADILQLECDVIQSFTPSVRNVDTDAHRAVLNTILEQRTHNVDVAELVSRDFRGYMAVNGESLDSVSPFSRKEAIESSGVPMFVQVGWLDAAQVEGALSRFMTFSNPQQVIIGPWSHGGKFETDPFSVPDAPVEPTLEEQYGVMAAFFDRYLKENQAAADSEISYYTMNAGTWSTTSTWPPEGFEMRRWYFDSESGLTLDAPTSEDAKDTYTVDFSATTGETSRWQTEVTTGDVIYPDRAAEDSKLLTYTSAPLENNMEITGSPVVTLYVTSTEADGAFHVYLEDVAPDGKVTYITEGILRAIHRNIDPDPPYTTAWPYHNLTEAAAAPLTPGEVAELQFSLYATSVLIEQEHQIRVAVAGADAGAFQRYPAEGTPTITVQRNTHYASAIDLPMRER